MRKREGEGLGKREGEGLVILLIGSGVAAAFGVRRLSLS